MNLGALRAHTRSHVLRDVPLPQAWSDVDLTFWLNEAEGKIARETFLLIDSDSTLAQITTTDGVTHYALDPRVLLVQGVSHGGRWLHKSVARPTSPWTGAPTRWAQRSGKLVIWPEPDAGYDVQLAVARLPLWPLEADTDVPEIPEQYHTTLCLWAGLQAVSNTDTQGANDVASFTKALDKRWGQAVIEIKREVFQQQRGW